jgi:hypothetical protein
MRALQSEFWNGHPERLPGGFTTTKTLGDYRLRAICEVWTNPRGWELRLMIDGHQTPMATVARSASEMLELVAQWQGALRDHGWS